MALVEDSSEGYARHYDGPVRVSEVEEQEEGEERRVRSVSARERLLDLTLAQVEDAVRVDERGAVATEHDFQRTDSQRSHSHHHKVEEHLF